jgi:hypothetical protein
MATAWPRWISELARGMDLFSTDSDTLGDAYS